MFRVEAEERVYNMLLGGASFEDVEEYINAQELKDHQKSALWLLAWVEQPREVQRRVARESLYSVLAPEPAFN